MNMRRILVLDDDIGVCMVLSRILEDQQYEVCTSHSVIGVTETLAEQSFDAYLLDYRLADGTGLQVAEKVRQQGSSVPIILISGYGATDIATEAIALDIFEVLQKPFSRETICNTLERALSQTLPAPVDAPQPAAKNPTLEPRLPGRLSIQQVIFITIGLLFVALCIFLIFR